MTKIVVVADAPTDEESGGLFFRGAASMLMKNGIRQACFQAGVPITSSSIEYMYLSESRFAAGLDTEVVPGKVLDDYTRKNFTQLEHLQEEPIFLSYSMQKIWVAFVERLREASPDLVIASGKWSLFFLGCYPKTEKSVGRLSQIRNSDKTKNVFGLSAKFRGSLLQVYSAILPKPTILIPIIPHAYAARLQSPKTIKADWDRIACVYRNLALGEAVPEDYISFVPKTTVFTEFEEAKLFLEQLLQKASTTPDFKLCVDLETKAKTIDTIGFAMDSKEGFAIPLLRNKVFRLNKYKELTKDKSGKEVTAYLGSEFTTLERLFSFEQEVELIWLCCQIFSHPNTRLIGHNFHYDCAFLYEAWGLLVHPWRCTMTLAAVLNNISKKGLAYLSSIYNDDYVYWKDDLNATNSMLRWEYCAKDCLNTFALWESLESELQLLPEHNKAYYFEKQEETAQNVLIRMLSGLAIDVAVRQNLDDTFSQLFDTAIQTIQDIVGYELNIYSTPQIRALFLDVLKIDPIKDRKRGTPTFSNAAMLKYAAKYPHYAQLCYLITETKSISTYLKTFMRAKLDEDNTLRSFIGVVGTKSYRFNSKKWLHGLGGNCMNWSEGRASLTHVTAAAAASYSEEEDESSEENDDFEVAELLAPQAPIIITPNSKQIVIPSHSDLRFINVDLKAGDLHIVAWMSDARWVKEILLSGGDVYTELAKVYYDDTTINKKHPKRQKFKAVCHALNYLGMENTIALLTGLEVNEVKRIKDFYFSANPEIVTGYQDKIINDCLKQGFTENIFGARYWCPTTDEKIDKTWRQKMVALVAQGTVSDVINRAMNITDKEERLRKANRQSYLKSKLQNHDAGLWEAKILDLEAEDRLDDYFGRIVLPFTDRYGKPSPLVMPWEISGSSLNYAECH